uniref:Uncharacterized protein n=1 Tax=Anopheles culicifacies TaxID=139723 RepID=A0A182M3D2_9DIPT
MENKVLQASGVTVFAMIVFLLFLGALLCASWTEALPDESFLITSVNKQNLLKALLQQESTTSDIGRRGSGQKDEDGYHYDRPKDPLCLLNDGPHCQPTKPDNGYLPPCSPGAQGPNCQPTAPVCPQGGVPPYCCTNGGNGPNCVLPDVPPLPPIHVHGHSGAPIVQVQTFVYGACTNGGSGPHCCTNGANTPDCVLSAPPIVIPAPPQPPPTRPPPPPPTRPPPPPPTTTRPRPPPTTRPPPPPTTTRPRPPPTTRPPPPPTTTRPRPPPTTRPPPPPTTTRPRPPPTTTRPRPPPTTTRPKPPPTTTLVTIVPSSTPAPFFTGSRVQGDTAAGVGQSSANAFVQAITPRPQPARPAPQTPRPQAAPAPQTPRPQAAPAPQTPRPQATPAPARQQPSARPQAPTPQRQNTGNGGFNQDFSNKAPVRPASVAGAGQCEGANCEHGFYYKLGDQAVIF